MSAMGHLHHIAARRRHASPPLRLPLLKAILILIQKSNRFQVTQRTHTYTILFLHHPRSKPIVTRQQTSWVVTTHNDVEATWSKWNTRATLAALLERREEAARAQILALRRRWVGASSFCNE